MLVLLQSFMSFAIFGFFPGFSWVCVFVCIFVGVSVRHNLPLHNLELFNYWGHHTDSYKIYNTWVTSISTYFRSINLIMYVEYSVRAIQWFCAGYNKNAIKCSLLMKRYSTDLHRQQTSTHCVCVSARNASFNSRAHLTKSKTQWYLKWFKCTCKI